MRKIIITIIITILLSGCSTTSTKETGQNLLDGVSMNWAERLEYYGKIFSTVINGLEANKDNDYFQGLSDGVILSLQTSSLYDQSKTIMIKNLNNYFLEEEVKLIETILYNLNESTYMLSQIIYHGEYKKDELPIERILKFSDQLNATGVSSTTLNFYNLIRNPNAVFKNNSKSDILELINNLKEDSTDLYDKLYEKREKLSTSNNEN